LPTSIALAFFSAVGPEMVPWMNTLLLFVLKPLWMAVVVTLPFSVFTVTVDPKIESS